MFIDAVIGNALVLWVNSHGRFVSIYFAIHQTLVSAFLHTKVDCKLRLAARPKGRVDSGVFLAVWGPLSAVEKTLCERCVHATA